MVDYLIIFVHINKVIYESNTVHIATPAGFGDTEAVTEVSSSDCLPNSAVLYLLT